MGSGVTMETELPIEWGPEKNVRWRVALPDRGNSTPVVWGDRVFITQPIESGHFRGTMCFDRETGDVLWQQGVTYSKPERSHRTNPYCSPSPVTDGERVVVSYGSAGVYCYDFKGKELWSRDFGPMDHVWGHAASPLIYGDLCFHYHGPGKGSRLYALDLKSGETVWEFAEPDWKPGERTDGFQGRDGEGVIGSFSTPIIVNTGERDELVMSFPMEIKAFDPGTGRELWRCEGLNPLVYSSPVFSEGIVVAMGGYYGNSIGVRAGGEGDVTESRRLWREERPWGGIGTGVATDGYLDVQDSGGIVYCLEMETGKTVWKERLPGKGKSWGSFVMSGDRIYTLSQGGDTVVFKGGLKFEEVALNDLGETTNSSLAVSDGELFIRTHEALWCIRDEDGK
jgi:outer membrane protein assembly factor BamB